VPRYSSELEDQFVYYVYGADDQVLYVGRSTNPDRRWQHHKHVRPDMCAATQRVEVKGPFKRRSAARLEQTAINELEPPFNHQLNGSATKPPLPSIKVVNNNIRVAIAREGTTQSKVARAIGMTTTAFSRRIRGEVSFRVSEIWAIADHLDTTVSALLEDSLADTG
jgi:excinuclease UvrABC nuclease subunit